MANDNNIQPMADDSQIVLYQPDESIRLEVKLEQDSKRLRVYTLHNSKKAVTAD